MSRRAGGDKRNKQGRLSQELQRQREEEERQRLVDQHIFCTLCREVDVPENLITPCECQDAKYWHYECLVRWIRQSRDRPCQICRHGIYTDPRITRRNLARRTDFYFNNPREGSFMAFTFGIGIIELVVMLGLFYWRIFTRGLNIFNISIGEFVALFVGLSTLFGSGLAAYRIDSTFREWAPYEDVIYFTDFDGHREVPVESGQHIIWEYHVGEDRLNDQMPELEDEQDDENDDEDLDD